MAELIKVLFRVCTGVGHEPYIKWDPDPPVGKGIFLAGAISQPIEKCRK